MFFILMSSLTLNLYAQNPLTVASLNKAWADRETEDGQIKILKLIQSEPKIPENFEIAWQMSRLVYFSGNFGIGEKLSKDEHIKMFEFGYKTAEIARKLNPDRVEGHYWYAVNLGSYGLARGVLTALSNAKIGRDALLEASKIDPMYHWAGAYRVLGRYYQEVPGIISFGDKKIAKEYFEKAIKIAPNFRLNTAYLGALESDGGDKEKALKLFQEAEKMTDVDGKEEESHYKRNLALDIKKIVD